MLLHVIIDMVFLKTCKAPRSSVAGSGSLSYYEKQPRVSGHRSNTLDATGVLWRLRSGVASGTEGSNCSDLRKENQKPYRSVVQQEMQMGVKRSLPFVVTDLENTGVGNISVGIWKGRSWYK